MLQKNKIEKKKEMLVKKQKYFCDVDYWNFYINKSLIMCV